MTNDPKMVDPALDVTFVFDDGHTETVHEHDARHIRGENTALRTLKPLLRVTCSNVRRTRKTGVFVFAAVIEDANGLSLLTPGEPRPVVVLLDLVRDLKTFPGSCPCGHLHTIDLGKLREAVARLRGLNYKARIVDVASVSA